MQPAPELDTDAAFESRDGLAVHAGKLYVTGFTSGVFPGQTGTPLQDIYVAQVDMR